MTRTAPAPAPVPLPLPLPDEAVVEKLDALLARFARSDQPGLVAGVALGGRTVYRRGFGLASVRHGVANTPATRVRIGSTTKHFTCLAALLLQEEGRLDIDAPARVLLPELPAAMDAITLRHFMRHTSGLRCTLEIASTVNPGQTMPEGWTLGAMARQQGRNFAPGEGQMYNNGGYHLLSIAIARAAGQSFEDVLRTRLFRPLGMAATDCLRSDRHLLPGCATLHLPDGAGGWRRGGVPVDDLLGEGSIVSTVDDMLRWLAHLRAEHHAVGSEATWQQMLHPAPLPNGRPSVYGMGLNRHRYRGVEVIHHAGSVAGGNSQMLTVPAHALDIVLMSNGVPISTQQLARDIVDTLLADVLTVPHDPLLPLAGHEHLLRTRWHADNGVLVAFGEAPGGVLGLSLMNSPPLPILRARAGGIASANFEDIALGPIEFRSAELADPERRTLHYSETGAVATLHRLPDEAPPPTGIAGRYRCADAAAELEIAPEGEALVLRVRGEFAGWQREGLQALSDHAFAVGDSRVLGGGVVMTAARDADGRVHTLWLDGLRVRHLEFTREGTL